MQSRGRGRVRVHCRNHRLDGVQATQTGARGRRWCLPAWALRALPPHHSPSRAPSKGASEPGASEVLRKQIVAFRENHEFRAFVFPAEENGKEPVLSKRPDSQGSPVPAHKGAPRGAEWTGRQRRQRPQAPSQAVGQAEHPGSWPARRRPPARLWSVPASLRCQPVVLTQPSPLPETPAG